MNQFEKDTMSQQAWLTRWAYLLKMGILEIKHDREKRMKLYLFLCVSALIWFFRYQIFNVEAAGLFRNIAAGLTDAACIMAFVVGLPVFLMVLGSAKDAWKTTLDLQRAGIVNRAGEAPFLLSKAPSKINPKVTILEFYQNGIPRPEWEDNLPRIEAALNVHVAKVADGSNKQRILLHVVDAENNLPELLPWKEEYLSMDSFVLVLGESILGPVTVNLSSIPHVLLGGSTGSGKSVLLKLLLMQAVKKGAYVFIADFKGGVDFPPVWHENCNLCYQEDELLEYLSEVVVQLESRKAILRKAGCPNIDVYNKTTGKRMQRYILACDEIAEVLDKTGLNKVQKERISQIENKLSIIARQGRAFGIHLILATQRPDATILSGQIRNNIDFRACGRADNVLSQIILDSTMAADMIPKDAKGRFVLHDGTVFQAYLFDDASW